MKNVEEQPKELASMGIANAYANAHNVDRIMENIEQYNENMVQMKEVLRKEENMRPSCQNLKGFNKDIRS